MKTVDNLLELVGNTPVLRLHPFETEGVRLYAKLEGFNPSGSVKDRTALAMLKAVKASGSLRPGMKIVEASSGNTGIGLAMVCRLEGFPLTIVMSKKASQERIAMLRAYGVELILTSREGGADEARRVADETAIKSPHLYFRLSQHRSRENVNMHYKWTAGELLEQVPGPIDAFVAGIGTGGTLMGISRRLRETYSNIRIIGVQPEEILSRQEGLRNVNKSVTPEIFDRKLLDEILEIQDKEAILRTRQLMERCGLLYGPSSGAILAGALKLVHDGMKGTIAMIFPDRGEKYLSTSIYQAEEE
ncbi:MAG: PLP-dependent cysteine synthase family protein [Deltaproteobacteria bacterium]|nr:PLP-dependent cysteine synthase family protein [Deltaproteobacteria bacterium]